ncbi:hypothetical protein [Cupriavidus pauculus]|uniref:hypothetical protein n=1 Tax=Cupriavidus pauculus TaxID=82633 RepID=UPI003857C5DB
MTEQSMERAAIAICRVMYPEAWEAGRSWEGFPDTTRVAMRRAAHAAWAELSEEVRAVIDHDGYAITFQSMSQYRAALKVAFSPDRAP